MASYRPEPASEHTVFPFRANLDGKNIFNLEFNDLILKWRGERDPRLIKTLIAIFYTTVQTRCGIEPNAHHSKIEAAARQQLEVPKWVPDLGYLFVFHFGCKIHDETFGTRHYDPGPIDRFLTDKRMKEIWQDLANYSQFDALEFATNVWFGINSPPAPPYSAAALMKEVVDPLKKLTDQFIEHIDGFALLPYGSKPTIFEEIFGGIEPLSAFRTTLAELAKLAIAYRIDASDKRIPRALFRNNKAKNAPAQQVAIMLWTFFVTYFGKPQYAKLATILSVLFPDRDFGDDDVKSLIRSVPKTKKVLVHLPDKISK